MVQSLKLLIALLLFATPCYAVDYSQDANCQLYAEMESVGNEIVAVGTDLTENGTIPRDADAKQGSWSRDWEDDGENDYLTHADGNETDIFGANQPISMGCWYKREDETGNPQILINKWDAVGGKRQYKLFVANNAGADDDITFGLSDNGGNNTEAFGATTVPTGAWTHIVAVYNDTDMRVYFNGSLDTNGADNPKAYTAGIHEAAEQFNIGTNHDNSDDWADGLIDELFVMDRELTAAEVLDIYTNGFEGSGRTTQTMLTSLE